MKKKKIILAIMLFCCALLAFAIGVQGMRLFLMSAENDSESKHNSALNDEESYKVCEDADYNKDNDSCKGDNSNNSADYSDCDNLSANEMIAAGVDRILSNIFDLSFDYIKPKEAEEVAVTDSEIVLDKGALSVIDFAKPSLSEAADGALDYSDLSNWVYCPTEHENQVDVFFLCPTSIQGEDLKIDLSNPNDVHEFLGTVNIEKGIYDDKADFYSPFYRQMTLLGYYDNVDEATREEYLANAYKDVRAAFSEYLDKYNDGRPIVLAGFSQGSDMMKRLLKEFEIEDKLVAAYMIGWHITDEDLSESDHLKMAEGEYDTGVIVSYCSESVEAESSVIVPVNTHGINPLNWKTDSTVADASENRGSCFSGFDGQIIEEEANMCGCYVDEKRGTLKVLDVTPEKFPPDLGFLNPGDYHVYDFLFFYRDLEQNVKDRIEVYISKR